jgi:lysyl-tRNA synthetase class 2
MTEADPAPSDDAADPAHGVAAEREHRLAKLDALRERGTEPYPYRFDRTTTLGELRSRLGHLEPGTETGEVVRVAGRALLIRRQGKLIFATVRDRSGELQLFVSKAVVGDGAFDRFDDLDLGDWVGVEGEVMTTRKGELSVKVTSFELLAKNLRPLPDKWKGLTDTDTRYRQRYVDLVVNEDARRAFEVRHAVVASFRRTLADQGFIEVETPVLHVEPGGAHARPFRTHHNALDMELFLRIALELHLKRLIVGGMERVFEIGRVFRNEGISTRHNPEFTMMELYQAFGDYSDVMAVTELLITQAARDALGTTIVRVGDTDVDLAQPWTRASIYDLIEEHGGIRVHPSMDLDRLRAACAANGVAPEPWMGPGALCFELYDALVERHLTGPVFVTGHPVEVSPLARVDRHDPWITERFELIVGGRELANGYSELNDPLVQRQRFEDEQTAKEAGNTEAGTVDEDYLRALEYGMPPTGGLGIGIDRVTMLLAGVTTIKDVILFPTLRPEVFARD